MVPSICTHENSVSSSEDENLDDMDDGCMPFAVLSRKSIDGIHLKNGRLGYVIWKLASECNVVFC